MALHATIDLYDSELPAQGYRAVLYDRLEGRIQPKHATKLNDQLTVLNIARRPEEMNLPGWQWHELRAELVGYWAVSVNGNWRLTFTFEGEDAVLVDYQDYR